VRKTRQIQSYLGRASAFFIMTLALGIVPANSALAVDTDGDTIDDSVDLDDDNDGILDGVENPASVNLIFDASDLPAPAKTYTNISGNGLDATLSHASPASVSSDSFLGPTVWTLFASGGIGGTSTITFDFSANPALAASFTILHINGTTATGGDEVEIYATTDNASTLTNPILTPQSATPSYVLGNGTATSSTTPNMASANNGPTGAPANLDVSFDSSNIPAGELITSITVLWRDVGGTVATHGMGLENLEFTSPSEVGTIDTDADGVINSLDLDSDNDGISDLRESGDAAGIVLDVDGNGTLGVAEDADTDADGLIDVFEDGNLATDAGTNPLDTDGDTVANYLDLDSDNDRIADTIEARATVGYVANDGNVSNDDTDDDGIIDLFDSNSVFGGTATHLNAPVDTDGNGYPDFTAGDSDSDGVSDTTESGLSSNGVDTDGDGIADDLGATYMDPEGAVSVPINDLENATDNDVADSDYRSVNDTDGDSVADFADLDDDNDGILDEIESPPVLGAITTGNNTPTPTGNFTNDRGVDIPFTLTGSDPTLNFISTMPGVTEGLQFRWVQPNSLVNFDVDLTLSAPVNGILRSIRVGDAAPGNTQVFANANKDVTLYWPGGGTGLLSDPNGDISSHNDGAIIHSGTVLTVVGGSILDSTWSVNIDLSGVTFPVTISYESVNFAAVKGNEGFSFSPVVDTDIDGDDVADHLDLDSDNDGISDLVESGGNTAAHVALVAADSNNDGTVALTESSDADGDGLMDIFDADTADTTAAASVGTVPVDSYDTLSDSLVDYLDLDSDDDGIPDATEARATADYVAYPAVVDQTADTDNDGILDIYDTASASFGFATGESNDAFIAGANTANDDNDDSADTIPDYLDLDSDDDGLLDSDADESGSISGVSYADPDGNVNNPFSGTINNNDGNSNGLGVDVDFRSIDDLVDSDNDGIPDSTENTNTPTLSNADSDGDGIDDAIDVDNTGGVDTDGDGVDDAFAATDTDGDGTPDYLDLDSDNDGIPDSIEDGNTPTLTGVDTDNDGIDDAIDVTQTGGIDTDGNGVDDAMEVSDSDGDGTPDYLDLDSDNDGILDAIEDSTTPALSGMDADDDGIDDAVDVDLTGGADVDGNGVDDSMEPTDTDGDGTPDYLDLDSDNDGILDTLEDATTPALTGTDTDGDGIDDAIDVDQTGGVDTNADGIDDSMEPTDTDGDGTPDYLDLDSDNDGILDTLEDTTTPPLTGVDTDGDGIDDAIDVDVTAGTDTDGDGIDDAMQPTDTDGDGIPDFQDIDADNDGIPDNSEDTTDTDGDGIDDALDVDITLGADVDGNGIDDAMEPTDTDGDGVADFLDVDSDKDGIPDILEDVDTPPLSGVDTDGDGIDDAIDVNATGGVDVDGDGIDDAFAPTDTDGDGTPDFLDIDSDNDGIPDNSEDTSLPALTGVDTDGDGIDDAIDVDATSGTDVDGDGVDDALAPTDSDGDGIPNHLDLDSDNDGLLDTLEDSNTPPLSGADADGDGIDDALDVDLTGGTDVDGDGIDDAMMPTDTDGDGVPDYLDLDSDNDGLPDTLEDSNTPPLSGVDTDGDGIDDALDVDLTGGAAMESMTP